MLHELLVFTFDFVFMLHELLVFVLQYSKFKWNSVFFCQIKSNINIFNIPAQSAIFPSF